MGISRTFISVYAELKENFRSDHMKLCFLWHDEVILDISNEYRANNYAYQMTSGESLSKEQISLITDVFVPLKNRVSQELLEAREATRPIGYPRWGKNLENFTYPEPENAEQHAHNILLCHIKRDWKICKFEGADVEQAEGRARVATDSVSLWEYIQQEVECMLEASYDERLAICAANMFNSETKKEIEPFSLFEASVPSLSLVPWSEVINIKKSGRFDKLRSKLGEIASSSSTLSSAQTELVKLETEATEEIIEKYRPKLKKVAIESALANIPGIPVANPFSVFFGLRDTYKEAKKQKEITWLYLLRDVRNLVK